MRIEEVKQQFLVGWLGSRLLIDLQVTAGVRGPRPGCHSLALLHPRTPPPSHLRSVALSLPPVHFKLSLVPTNLSPSSLAIDSTSSSLALFLSLSLLLIIILFGRPFHPLGGDSWFLYCSPLPSSSAFFVLPLLGTKC